MDGNDYWVWQALTACTGRVVVLEYNSMFGPDRAVTIPYDPAFNRRDHRFCYFGASLAALTKLSQQQGLSPGRRRSDRGQRVLPPQRPGAGDSRSRPAKRLSHQRQIQRSNPPEGHRRLQVGGRNRPRDRRRRLRRLDVVPRLTMPGRAAVAAIALVTAAFGVVFGRIPWPRIDLANACSAPPYSRGPIRSGRLSAAASSIGPS